MVEIARYIYQFIQQHVAYLWFPSKPVKMGCVIFDREHFSTQFMTNGGAI